MATFPDLNSVTVVAGADEVLTRQGSEDKRVTQTLIKDFVKTGLTASEVAFSGGTDVQDQLDDNTTDISTNASDITALGVQTTADILAAAGSYLFLTADSTRTSTTTATSESDFNDVESIPAGASVKVEGLLLLDQGGAENGGLSLIMGDPVARQDFLFMFAVGAAGSGHIEDVAYAGSEIILSLTPAEMGTNDIVLQLKGVITNTTGSPVDFAFRWAQQTSDATATTMSTGSYLHFRQISP